MIWKGENVLITGATHFIGSHLAEKLVMLGSNVKALIRYDYQNSRGSLDRLPVYIGNKIDVIYGSLTNPETVDYATENTGIVFHLGVLDMLPFYTNVRDYLELDMLPLHTNVRDYLEKAIIGTLNVLNAAKKYNVKKLVHISTAEVYGKVDNMPISEDCPLKAQSPHIGSDIGAEKLVEGYCLSYDLPVTIARLFNAYGPVQSGDAVAPTIITQGIVGMKLFLGDVRAVRDFIYVDDVVEGLMKMAEISGSIGEAINLGSGEGTSIENLAKKIMTLIGRDVEIIFDALKIRLQDTGIEKLVADISKARDLLGWQPSTSLDMGLRQTIEWFSEHSRI